ncbi:Rpn family recombination-promoting nuclease/putative transposase [Thermoanaerobacter siderophilus]|uniref:Transposase (putative) YhgA-like domain-containing protein n=1 Tax=Thermoanaerobacter siderophilus SR4 TaxID=880478 RepID=I9KSS6_9THEO|nr:Rpn family recombination-promoting nuclease/putative transposase [Thermoanaerobacter siderophilus]EIV99885.1 hypothetical protein ThesiDRAFT1_0899 [Thermoanaerobacter siderophilus SR4]HHY79241.1 Rpn family recombination-promoting nuclease/putative transposase [Thermoanaerobacter sp.]
MGQEYDIAAKSIFSNLADDIASYFLGLTYTKIDELNIEFTIVESRESDMIFKCTTDYGDIALHMEFQTYNDNKMPYRMLRYATEIMEKHNLVPYQVVIYFGKNELKMEDKLDYHLGKKNFLNFHYRLIDMGEVKFEDIAETKYYDLYAFLPLVDKEKRQKEEEEYLKKCAEAIRDMPVDKGKKENIVTSAQILAGIVYDKEIIERIFSEVIGMSILEESKIYREILEKGKKEGEREKSIEIAKELLKEGMDINKIAQITKLSVEEIKKLLN